MAKNPEFPPPCTGGGNSPEPVDLMTPAELRVVTEWLGLRQRDVASLLGVNERTVRGWLAGAAPVPDGVRVEIERWEEFTGGVVGEVVAALNDLRDPAIRAGYTDQDLWAARPEFRPWPASWWRMVVARAVQEVPGVEIH